MENEKICQTCKHFRQHYVRTARGSYTMCGSGHCVFPRRKPRRNDAKACEHYIPKEK